MRRLAALVLIAVTAACGTVDLGPTPADVGACRPSKEFFVNEIWPNFLNKDYGGKRCYDSNCHGAGSRQVLILEPPSSAPSVPLNPAWEALYKSVTEHVLCTNVDSSRLITKPDGRQAHGGLKLIEPDGPEETLVKMWVLAK